MVLQTLTDTLVSVGLSRATAICKHPWESAWSLRGKTEKGRKREAKLDKVKCSSSALPYFLLFKIQLREKHTNFWVLNILSILGNNLILCFITFSLNKICTASARYDNTRVGLYNLLYETDPWIGKLWNRILTKKKHWVKAHSQVLIVQQGAVRQMTTLIKRTLTL